MPKVELNNCIITNNVLLCLQNNKHIQMLFINNIILELNEKILIIEVIL